MIGMLAAFGMAVAYGLIELIIGAPSVLIIGLALFIAAGWTRSRRAAGPSPGPAWCWRRRSWQRMSATTARPVRLVCTRRCLPGGRNDAGRVRPRPRAADANPARRRLASAHPILRRSVPAGCYPRGRQGRCDAPYLMHRRKTRMPEPAAPRPDPGPAGAPPRASPTGPSPNGTSPGGPVPPVPSEVTNTSRRGRRPAEGRWLRATMPLRKMMRRTPSRP
jgi:hypothetical protein